MTEPAANALIMRAITAVEEKQQEPGNDLILENQLESAVAQLREMLVELESGRRVRSDPTWIAQMVADQWDPFWVVTDLVLQATQAFEKGRPSPRE